MKLFQHGADIANILGKYFYHFTFKIEATRAYPCLDPATLNTDQYLTN